MKVQADGHHPGLHDAAAVGGPWGGFEPTPWADAVAMVAYLATGALLVAIATA